MVGKERLKSFDEKLPTNSSRKNIFSPQEASGEVEEDDLGEG